MKTRFGILFFILILNGLILYCTPVYNVKDFGAKGDSITLETSAIQKAIDKAFSEGGGTVLIPPGIYRTGCIILKDNITLNIVAGAKLLGSPDIKDYSEIIHKFDSRTNGLYAKHFVLFAERANNISITGTGIIDGNGLKNFQQTRPQNSRPFLIRLVECQNVIIRDVQLLQAANWTCHLLACKNVIVDGVRMENDTRGNGDGLDIDGSSNVRVSNCIFSTVDDAIVMKATSDVITRDVTISNCNITSKRGSALKTGTESNGGFKNISISNCTIKDTPAYAGIEFMTVDGGVLENITVTNIVMENVGAPVFVQLGNRARPFMLGQYVDHVSRVQDISFSHIYVDNARLPVMISGLKWRKINNISFDDISINYYKTTDKPAMAFNQVPPEEMAYPMCTMYGTNLPAYGFYGRNVENLMIRNVRVYTKSAEEVRPAFLFDNVRGTEINSVQATVNPNTPAMIYLRLCDNISLAYNHSIGENGNLVIAENNCKQIINSNNILKPSQAELKKAEPLPDRYSFDDIEAEAKFEIPQGKIIDGFNSQALSDGPVKFTFNVKKGQFYQVCLFTLNVSDSSEKILLKYKGTSQEFLVDWDQWGWAPLTLINQFEKDETISFEVQPGKPGSALKLGKVYLHPISLGYTD